MSSQTSMPQMERMVQDAIDKEEMLWRPLKLSGSETKVGAAVTYEHRSDVIEWQACVADKFQFYPEAQSLAVSILDKFLASVKVQTKYLKCVALSCLFIACKITEEDECVPHISDFVTQSSANCSTDDLVRMERLILNKLEWDVNLATPLHFLQVCHAFLMAEHPDLLSTVPHMTPDRQLTFLTHKLRLCMMSREFCQWSPSLVAVSLLSLELEQFRAGWFPLTLTLLMFIKKSNFTQLIGCREGLSSHMMMLVDQARSERAEVCRQHKRTRHHTEGMSKRKMMEAPGDQDDIYSSIKELYKEEEPANQSTAALLTSED